METMVDREELRTGEGTSGLDHRSAVPVGRGLPGDYWGDRRQRHRLLSTALVVKGSASGRVGAEGREPRPALEHVRAGPLHRTARLSPLSLDIPRTTRAPGRPSVRGMNLTAAIAADERLRYGRDDGAEGTATRTAPRRPRQKGRRRLQTGGRALQAGRQRGRRRLHAGRRAVQTS